MTQTHSSAGIAQNTVLPAVFSVHLCCADCGTMLNSTPEATAKDIRKDWTMIVMSSAFNAGKCPNNCRSTFTDMNINTELKIYNVTKAEYVDKKDFFDRNGR